MISSLVLLLESREFVAPVIDSLTQIDGVEVGELVELRLPVVIEAKGPRETQQLTDQIAALAGVSHFDVAYVSLEE